MPGAYYQLQLDFGAAAEAVAYLDGFGDGGGRLELALSVGQVVALVEVEGDRGTEPAGFRWQPPDKLRAAVRARPGRLRALGTFHR